MQTLNYSQPDFDEALAALCRRSAFDDDVESQVAEILRGIRDRGDAAVTEYAARFDAVALKPERFRVGADEIAAAEASVPAADRDAIITAHAQLAAFAGERLPKDWNDAPREGVVVGEKFVPLSRVVAYIPGGSAPLVSTVLHTITMASVAGVKEIVVTTPVASDGAVAPAVLFAASVAGATEVYRLGGVYAIGAFAYGTETIVAAEKIVGPGNAYVTAAKRQVYGVVAVDLVAGPSEVLIIADASARADWIAADLLAQAEHGSGREQALLVTDSEVLVAAVFDALTEQAATLPRREAVAEVLENGTYLICVQDLAQCVDVANRFAAEHVEIMTADARALADGITVAGAIFIGPWTPEPVGDFVAGPSHVLPTGGGARRFSGLTVDQFLRRISTAEYDRDALAREAWMIERFAAMEDLDAHGRSVSLRQEPPSS